MMAATTGLCDFSTSKRKSWQPLDKVVASSAFLHLKIKEENKGRFREM
jgi:hypothetical protein